MKKDKQLCILYTVVACCLCFALFVFVLFLFVLFFGIELTLNTLSNCQTFVVELLNHNIWFKKANAEKFYYLKLLHTSFLQNVGHFVK